MRSRSRQRRGREGGAGSCGVGKSSVINSALATGAKQPPRPPLANAAAARSDNNYLLRPANTSFRMKWVAVVMAVLVVVVAVAVAEGEIWEEDDREVLIRNERGAKSRGEVKEGSKSRDPCRYVKGAWSDCDSKTNMRTRILTLKKGDQATCEQTKTIQKKCKKACRYEKGTWSECSSENQMTRTDSLKPNSDPSCEQSRLITKKCKNKGAKNNNKGGRRNRQ